jgi:hypothetical protein
VPLDALDEVLSLSLVLATFATVFVLINVSRVETVTVSLLEEVALLATTSLDDEPSVNVVVRVVIAVVIVVVVTVDVSV